MNDTNEKEAHLRQPASVPAAVAEGMREFVESIAAQTPEKPDYWSSCGQCERNSDRAQELLAAAPSASTALPAASDLSQGFALVPAEPTEAMLDVLHNKVRILCEPDKQSASILNDKELWRLVLAAAPTAQAGMEPFKPDWTNYRQGLEDGRAEGAQAGELPPMPEKAAILQDAYGRLVRGAIGNEQFFNIAWEAGQACAQAAIAGAGKPIDVDQLANFIRSIDGNNKMGAGALAERIADWLTSTPTAIAGSADAKDAAEWPQQVFELCNFLLAQGWRMTPAMEQCMLNATGDMNKYPNPINALAKAAIAASAAKGEQS